MQSIDLKKIGNEIKVRRVKQGIQQTALAEMLDITQTHLSNIENGRVPGSLKLLLKLRSIFGCLALELFRDRAQASGRLLRRHLPHGRGAGATDETPRGRGA